MTSDQELTLEFIKASGQVTATRSDDPFCLKGLPVYGVESTPAHLRALGDLAYRVASAMEREESAKWRKGADLGGFVGPEESAYDEALHQEADRAFAATVVKGLEGRDR